MLKFNVPGAITAGDRVVWFDADLRGLNVETGVWVNFTPDLYTLSFSFRGNSALDVMATGEGDRFKSVIAADDSSLLEGICQWQAYITDASGDRTTVGMGQMLVQPNLAMATTVPPTATVALQQQLDRVNAAIDALVVGRPVAEYEINGRRLKYLALADLQALRKDLQLDLVRSRAAEQIKNGQNPRRRYVRFDGAR